MSQDLLCNVCVCVVSHSSYTTQWNSRGQFSCSLVPHDIFSNLFCAHVSQGPVSTGYSYSCARYVRMNMCLCSSGHTELPAHLTGGLRVRSELKHAGKPARVTAPQPVWTSSHERHRRVEVTETSQTEKHNAGSSEMFLWEGLTAVLSVKMSRAHVL